MLYAVTRSDTHAQRGHHSRPISVMSWNVLAAPFTKYNKEAPGCVQGHLNPHSQIETAAQTRARYGLATQAMMSAKPDVLLLQE